MQKIIVKELLEILSPHLKGVVFFEILSKMQLATEVDGSVQAHVIDNIKVYTKIAIEQQLHSKHTYYEKAKLALKSLLPYGTREVSERMDHFLNEHVAATDSTLQPSYLFNSVESTENLEPLRLTLETIVNQMVQTEDDEEEIVIKPEVIEISQKMVGFLLKNKQTRDGYRYIIATVCPEVSGLVDNEEYITQPSIAMMIVLRTPGFPLPEKNKEEFFDAMIESVGISIEDFTEWIKDVKFYQDQGIDFFVVNPMNAN